MGHPADVRRARVELQKAARDYAHAWKKHVHSEKAGTAGALAEAEAEHERAAKAFVAALS